MSEQNHVYFDGIKYPIKGKPILSNFLDRQNKVVWRRHDGEVCVDLFKTPESATEHYEQVRDVMGEGDRLSLHIGSDT